MFQPVYTLERSQSDCILALAGAASPQCRNPILSVRKDHLTIIPIEQRACGTQCRPVSVLFLGIPMPEMQRQEQEKDMIMPHHKWGVRRLCMPYHDSFHAHAAKPSANIEFVIFGTGLTRTLTGRLA